MEKADQKWVEETLASLHNIPKAVAPDDLFEKIESKIDACKVRKLSSMQALGWAVAALLFLGLNFSVFYQSLTHLEDIARSNSQSAPAFISDFEIYD